MLVNYFCNIFLSLPIFFSRITKSKEKFMSANSYKPEGARLGSAENREYLSSLQGLEKAMLCGKILEAPVLLCDSKMRLHLDLGGITGIMEKEEVVYSPDGTPVKDIAVITRVGKPVCFKVLGIENQGGKPVARLSRRDAQLECIHNHISCLLCGDILEARVTHLENFGAFVDIGCGIVSLLSSACISVSATAHPSERFTVGWPISPSSRASTVSVAAFSFPAVSFSARGKKTWQNLK